MPNDLQTIGPRNGTSPLTVSIVDLGETDLQTAFAHFDGTSASGAWRPSLTIKSQSGAILARLFPETELAVGDTADVTYSPFARRRATSPSGATYASVIAALMATHTCQGYWTLGDGSSPFADTSGYPTGPANMTINTGAGAPYTAAYSPGALPGAQDDGAVAFNVAGSGMAGDYLHASDPISNSRFNFTGTDMTVLGFVKPFASAAASTGAVIGMWAQGVSGSGGWRVAVDWPLRTLYAQKGGDTQPLGTVTGPTLAADTWVFVAFTESATNGLRLYVNGSLYATTAGNYQASPTYNLGPYIALGHSGFPLSGTFYGGVDEISLWSDEFSSAEIAELATAAGYA